jgi:hypothetical protein
VTDAEIRRGEGLCRRCRRSSAAVGPLLLVVALIAAPVIGVAEALMR